MAFESDQFIHLSRPLAPTNAGIQHNISPLNVHIHPQAITSILDHAVRRDVNDMESARVIGALVGSRSEDGSEVEVRGCFAVPHTENEDEVQVDVDYQKNMLAMTLRTSPREALLGWYTTSSELNSFSSLIQNYFASVDTGTFPHPAIHLTLSTAPGAEIKLRTYISAPVAVNPERDSCLFIQVPHHITFSDPERSALEAFDAAKNEETRTAPISTDIESLSHALQETIVMLERVSEWVSSVLDEEEEPNNVVGQFLLNALSLAPKVDPVQIEQDFNNHIQDVLMVSYLANTIRTQIELSQRLAMSNLTLVEKEGEGGKASEQGEKGDQRGSTRGGKRTTRGGPSGRGGGQTREPREPRERRESNDI